MSMWSLPSNHSLIDEQMKNLKLKIPVTQTKSNMVNPEL